MKRLTILACVASLGAGAYFATASDALAQSGYGFKVRIGNVQIGGFKVDGDRYYPGHLDPYHAPRPVVVAPSYVPVDPYVRRPVVVAPEPVVVVPQHYHVLYRTCPHEPWCEYGRFRCHEQAHDVADLLRFRGYQARVLHH